MKMLGDEVCMMLTITLRISPRQCCPPIYMIKGPIWEGTKAVMSKCGSHAWVSVTQSIKDGMIRIKICLHRLHGGAACHHAIGWNPLNMQHTNSLSM